MRIRRYILFFCVPIFLAFKIQSDITIDEQEAKKAFEQLNTARSNPKAYGAQIKINLDKVEKRTALVWNDTLAKVAQQKAIDMARKKYFGHITPDGKGINVMIDAAGYTLPKEWLKSKKENYFESIVAGVTSGEDAIKTLIIDAFEPSLGHRKHLLGIDDWNAGLKDVGIGYVKAPGTEYKVYVCVIIAKRAW